jgi:adenylate cyclase
MTQEQKRWHGTVTSTELTALFSDIADSTQLYEKLGNTQALAEIRRGIDLITEHAQLHGGLVVKSLGDGVLVTFDAPADAYSAAVATATAFYQTSTLSLRTGFHHGPVVWQQGDVFGDAVNIAARLAAFATRGQVLTTSATMQLLPTAQRSRCRALGAHHLKGKEQAVGIEEVLLQSLGELTVIMPALARSQGAAAAKRLLLKYAGTTRFMAAPILRLSLGRGSQADVLVQDALASRVHAVLELRGEQFVLLDQSSNGTYVRSGDQAFLRLNRQEHVLQGSGEIRFSPQSLAPDSEPMHYAVEDVSLSK